jgi:hypothetical protein
LERLKQQVSNGLKDPESIIDAFKEIKQSISDRN